MNPLEFDDGLIRYRKGRNSGKGQSPETTTYLVPRRAGIPPPIGRRRFRGGREGSRWRGGLDESDSWDTWTADEGSADPGRTRGRDRLSFLGQRRSDRRRGNISPYEGNVHAAAVEGWVEVSTSLPTDRTLSFPSKRRSLFASPNTNTFNSYG
ncbi:hypothetical protein CDL15_Pgr009634 [Punica granatum]|uniref:Uncharacterized protein n=1 Tax=Punica granatum TaxID=22663 RepID=A0A218WU06_PUNGR|nr:hypothetical protein CDL15_Pgr009634 [Punica granatum]